MELLKSKQTTDYTCGPACLRTVYSALTGRTIDEATVAFLAESQPSYGTYVDQLAEAATLLNLPNRVIRRTTREQFNALRQEHFLLLLVSTGPTYGHWVLSVPGMRSEAIIDDPWDPQYWQMSWEQLNDCWHWSFPNRFVEDHAMIVIASTVSSEQRDAFQQVPSQRWNLPRLAAFPPQFVWSEKAIAHYRQTGSFQ